MRKPKMYFAIHCRSSIWLRRSIQFFKGIILISTFSILISTNHSYLVIALILFIIFFIVKIIPIPHQDSIEVYFDRLIYKTKIKDVEVYFNHIAFIDQDVVEAHEGDTYYKTIEFLDESMASILYIEARGYSYDGLVVLCNRIYSVNQEFSTSENTSRSIFNLDNDKQEVI
ncbi:hypothetical protein ACOMCU_22385 [Lysinibacillus sp. UGB7]|uniref:hypothetical protein n=1 Tax=Lysinibacillus sp. UGB7 TaxID=3411039 RepID=UPI003B7F8A90